MLRHKGNFAASDRANHVKPCESDNGRGGRTQVGGDRVNCNP